MPQLLTLRGRHALSPFRVAKLRAALAASRPDNAVSSISAEYWHFVELESRTLVHRTRHALDRLLTYGAHDEMGIDRGDLFVVVRVRERFHRGLRRPRISPKLRSRRRPADRTRRRLSRRRRRAANRLALPDQAALLPLLHDRMTEAVLPRLEDAQRCSRIFRRGRSRRCPCSPRPRRDRSANVALGLALAPDEIDYLLDDFRAHRPRSDRRRAHDVRAGQLRALPPQDLQRATG